MFTSLFSRSIIFFSLLCCTPLLQAEEWGKTGKSQTHEGTQWNEIYFAEGGVNFSAQIPNYSGSSTTEDEEVVLCGNVKREYIYAIAVSKEPNFTPPKKIETFVEMVKEGNPDFEVVIVPSRKMGAKHVVDLIPLDKEGFHWRFVCTQDRIIQMVTDDTHVKRRQYFFDSILVKKSLR